MNNRIKEIAQKKGITQTVLAEKLGISLANVKKIYLKDNLTLKTLERIANALDCEVWQLIVSDYEVLRTSSAEVKCPKCHKRIPLKNLEFCFDSVL